MTTPGMSESEARSFLARELARHESTTSFYWANEETEEAVELIVEAVAKLRAADNMKMETDRRAEALRERASH